MVMRRASRSGRDSRSEHEPGSPNLTGSDCLAPQKSPIEQKSMLATDGECLSCVATAYVPNRKQPLPVAVDHRPSTHDLFLLTSTEEESKEQHSLTLTSGTLTDAVL